MAEERRECVLLATLCAYVDSGYTEERFNAGELDYAYGAPPVVPVEKYGALETVTRTISRQNKALEQVHAQFPASILYDAATLMPIGKRCFKDVCHFTDEGLAVFARGVADAYRAGRLPGIDVR